MYLLDTNVVSEMRKIGTHRADPAVARWEASVPASAMFISAITIFELELGIVRLDRRDHVAADVLRRWFERLVVPSFAQKTVDLDFTIARRAARLHVPDPRPQADAIIAATALVHGMTVVTRNTRDFAAMGVPLLNPWDTERTGP